MKKITLILLSLLFLTGCSAEKGQAEYRQVSSAEAQTMMEETSDYIILDVRTPEEFFSEHITGAVNLPLQEIGDQPPAALPRKDQVIFVYCRSGNRSKTASQKLADLGYTQIVEFGGIGSWKGASTSNSP